MKLKMFWFCFFSVIVDAFECTKIIKWFSPYFVFFPVFISSIVNFLLSVTHKVNSRWDATNNISCLIQWKKNERESEAIFFFLFSSHFNSFDQLTNREFKSFEWVRKFVDKVKFFSLRFILSINSHRRSIVCAGSFQGILTPSSISVGVVVERIQSSFSVCVYNLANRFCCLFSCFTSLRLFHLLKLLAVFLLLFLLCFFSPSCFVSFDSFVSLSNWTNHIVLLNRSMVKITMEF